MIILSIYYVGTVQGCKFELENLNSQFRQQVCEFDFGSLYYSYVYPLSRLMWNTLYNLKRMPKNDVTVSGYLSAIADNP